jgi:putative transcriptional regulator
MSNSILDSVKDTITDLHSAGLVDDVTMKNIESLCIPEVKDYDAVHIANLRKRLRLSQAAFARFLNISPSTIRQWETGDKHPSGACQKLLNLADQKGLSGLM